MRPIRSAIRPKTMPPDGPTEEQNGSQQAGPIGSGGFGFGRADTEMQQGGDAVRGDIVKQQAVEYVKAPAEPGGEQHRPLVAVHAQQAARRRVSEGSSCDAHLFGQ